MSHDDKLPGKIIQLRRDTEANWTIDNPVLAVGETGWTTDTRRVKLGDGATAWVDLPYTDDAASDDGKTAKTARALRRFHVALSNVSNEPVDILVGPTDSIGDGQSATLTSTRFVGVLRDRLRDMYQPGGVLGGFGYSDFWNQGTFPDSPVTPVNPVVNQTKGLGLQSLDMDSNTQTITIEDTFTSALICYRTAPGAGYLFYTVDGGAPVGVDANLPAGEATETVGPLPAGVHEIILYGGITPDPVTYEGVFLMNGDEAAGIRVWEAGQSGYRAADYVAQTGWADAVDRVQPSLVVLPIGSNDYATGRSPAATKADILSILTAIRANTTVAPSVVLLSYYDRDNGGSTYTWEQFRTMYNEIAAADPDIVWLDMTSAFGPWVGDDRGGLTDPVDEVHPTDAGHFSIGAALVNLISEVD